MTDMVQQVASRMYFAGIQRGMVMGFCLGALVVWFAK